MISFTNVTMESEKFICVRETGTANSVVIVDVASPSQPLKRPITADSALMNPEQRIIALKATTAESDGKDHLQIFNIEQKVKDEESSDGRTGCFLEMVGCDDVRGGDKYVGISLVDERGLGAGEGF